MNDWFGAKATYWVNCPGIKYRMGREEGTLDWAYEILAFNKESNGQAKDIEKVGAER